MMDRAEYWLTTILFWISIFVVWLLGVSLKAEPIYVIISYVFVSIIYYLVIYYENRVVN
jgi:hypothetical protein